MSKNGKVYFELENYRLYWGKGFSAEEIFIRWFSLQISRAVKAILLLFFLSGLFLIAVYFFSFVLKEKLPLFELETWQHSSFIYFLWALVGWMYWFFLIKKDSQKMLQVLKKSFKKKMVDHKIREVEISEGFTAEALTCLEKAFLEANRKKRIFNSFYLFKNLLNLNDLRGIFIRLEVSWKDLKSVMDRLINLFPQNGGGVDPKIEQILFDAYVLAYHDRRPKVEAADLLQVIVSSDKNLEDILLDFKLSGEKITNAVKWLNISNKLSQRYKHYRSRAYLKPKGVMNRAMTALATPALDSYSEDLTHLARAGLLPLCVAREKEIEEIFNIIEGGASSVLLIGLHGVGKSNIIEGIANMMVAEEVPEILQDKRLVSLSIAHLVGGATHPNELQERALIIMNEIIRAGNVILHIDNIHDLVGLSSAGTENVDLAEIFSKFLNHKQIIVIATTTPQDFHAVIEGGALAENMSTVQIPEPDDNRAIQMIESKTAFLEGKNQVFFSYNSLEKAVKLSRRYVPESSLPDKAYKILEEVAAWTKSERGANQLVLAEDVASVISHRTGIPLTEISQEESAKLLNLEERIHQRMVNQEEAVKMVATALRRARAELRDTKRPIVNLLFLGPTGVGKTELAKSVAEVYFGAEEKMVRLDMSEYQEQRSLSRILGDAVSGIKGVLTEAVRTQPFSLVLLDEIEKAHPDILNLFLQVMDDGRLTDAFGRTVDFTNCIVIATSNAGTQFIQDNLRAGASLAEIKKNLIQNELRGIFRPEFLNRFDGVLVFTPLSTEHLEQITRLMLAKVRKRLVEKGIYLEVTEAAVKELSQAGFDPLFGARPLRRLIQERVDDSLATFLLSQKISRRDVVVFDAGGQISIQKARKL